MRTIEIVSITVWKLCIFVEIDTFPKVYHLKDARILAEASTHKKGREVFETRSQHKQEKCENNNDFLMESVMYLRFPPHI